MGNYTIIKLTLYTYAYIMIYLDDEEWSVLKDKHSIRATTLSTGTSLSGTQIFITDIFCENI